MARGHIRKTLLIAGSAMLLVGGLLTGSIFGGPYLVAKILHENGFPDAHVEGVSLTPVGVYIDRISLDANEFSTIDQVSIGFSWGDIISSRHLDRISIKKMELVAEIDESGHFKLAGWDATAPTSSSSSVLLPVTSLLVQGATLDLDTPEGDIRIEGKATIDTNATKDVQTVALSLWGKQRQLSFTINGNGKISNDGAYDFSAELLDGRVNVPQVELSRVSGWAAINKTAGSPSPVYSGQISAGRVKALNALLQNIDFVFDTAKDDPFFFKTSPSGFPNVVLAGRWNAKPPAQIEITVDAQDASDLYKILNESPDEAALDYLREFSPVTIQVALPPSVLENTAAKDAAWAVLAGTEKTRFSGVASYQTETGHAAFTLLPVTLSANTLKTLLPLQKNFGLLLNQGQVTAEGKISLVRERNSFTVTGPLSVDLQKLGGEWNGVLFGNLVGKLRLPSLLPWKTDNTSLSYTLLSKEAEIGTGNVTFQGSGNKGLSVSSLRLNVAGGTVTTSPFILLSPEQQSETDIHVKLDRLQMADLSKLAAIDSFSATGQISGTIPLSVRDGKISFKNGAIANSGEGYFKYAPEQFPTSLQGDDPRMQTVRDALSDFQFTELSLDLNGPMDGHMMTVLKAKGTSPLFGDRPIALNLNLEGDLGQILRNTLQAGDIGSTLRSAKGDKK